MLVYRLNETPVADGCTLTTEAQQQLIFSQDDPLNKGVDGSFYLEPGEQVLVTFRVFPDVEAETPLDPVATFVPDDLGGIVSAQPPNTNPASMPPADAFGPPANVIPATAGGLLIGAGGTAPISGGPLTAGQQVSVTATGFVRGGDPLIFPLVTPDGSGPCGGTCLLPGAPAFSLVGRIAGGPWQLVGEGPTILTAASTGELEFAVNDNGYDDNTGNFFVSVSPVARCDIAGDWSGTYVQGSFEYPIVVTNFTCPTPGSVTADGEYPTLECSGDWTLDAIVGDTLFVTENVIGSACVPVVAHELTLDNGVLNGVTPAFSSSFSMLPTTTSTFANDADEWSIANDSGGWVATGGNPLGYLAGSDSGGATGSTAWYFSAPDKFLGDQSAFDGGTLSYDLQQSDNAPTLTDLPWVILRGNGVTLVYDAGASALPGTDWTPFAVPLDANAPGWYIADDACWTFSIVSLDVCNFAGAAPTPAQFASVLANLDTLLIRGEYSVTLDSGGLDNVELVSGISPAFTEIVIQDDTDIANSGVLVVANDLGISPGAVTVNGVTFGTDQSGQAPGEWQVSGGNTFSNESLSPELDNLLDDLVFVNFGRANVDSTFSIGGLTPGNDYRLQMLFSNDINNTGNNVEVTVEGETWLLDSWKPDPINLSTEFTATGTTVDIVFTGGPGSSSESGRAVLNAYVVHDITPGVGPVAGTVWRADIDFTNVSPDGPYDCLRHQWVFNEPLAPGEGFTFEIFDEEGGPAIASQVFTSNFASPITNVGFEVFLSGTALADGVGYEVMTFTQPFDLDSLSLRGDTTCITGAQTPFIDTILTVDP